MYRGSAGVALFLSELAWVTGRSDFRDVAREALLFALHSESDDGLPFSLYSGDVGTIFAAGAFLRRSDDPVLRSLALELLSDLSENPADPGCDYIGGASGAIIGLLGVADVFGGDLVESMCDRLGTHLLQSAFVEPQGLSWHSGVARGGNLCGLGHGAAGIGWPLLELSLRTGRESFRLAAEEAFHYEESQYDAGERNWPDLRNNELTEIITDGRIREVDTLLAKGEPAPLYDKGFMTAWCHGAPGIGLTRARAFQVLGTDRYRVEAEDARETTARWLNLGWKSDSICHGSVGNAVAALLIGRMVGAPARVEPALRELLRTRARELEARDARWVPGGPERVQPDYSLMLGDAGVGLGLLELDHCVVSAVFPIPRRSAGAPKAVDDASPVRAKILSELFPWSASTMHEEEVAALTSKGISADRSTSSTLVDAIKARAKAVADPNVAVQFMKDEAAIRRAEEGLDRTVLLLLRRGRLRQVGSERLVFAPWASVVETDAGALLLYPEPSGRWAARSVSSALGALLECLRSPGTEEEIADRFRGFADAQPDAFASWVHRQLLELVQACVVVRAALARSLAPRVAADAVARKAEASSAREDATRQTGVAQRGG